MNANEAKDKKKYHYPKRSPPESMFKSLIVPKIQINEGWFWRGCLKDKRVYMDIGGKLGSIAVVQVEDNIGIRIAL